MTGGGFDYKGTHDPAGWPEELLEVFERSVTCSFATLTRAGRPITWPVNPYPGEDGRTIDVSTGITYPSKADRARTQPNVGLTFADPVGSGLDNPPIVVIKGEATVRDADLQAGADRYARVALEKMPAAWKGTPRVLMRAQRWYWTRIWVLVTPLEMWWWPDGRMVGEPKHWKAPKSIFVPPSDPPPTGKPLPVADAPVDVESRIDEALRLGLPELSVVDVDHPVSIPMEGARRGPDGFYLRLPPDVPFSMVGAGCLTFHDHAEIFDGQRNAVFLGRAEPAGDETLFRVERALPDFSLGGSRFERSRSFFAQRKRFSSRLKHEVERRGQTVPRVDL